jgi:hypothetical protein
MSELLLNLVKAISEPSGETASDSSSKVGLSVRFVSPVPSRFLVKTSVPYLRLSLMKAILSPSGKKEGEWS